MAYSKKRVEKELAEFRRITGAKDPDEVTGAELGDQELRKKSHAFWAINRDEEGVCGHVVLGHIVEGMINDDKYDFVYLGRTGSEEMKSKVEELAAIQQDAILEGHVRGFIRQGYGLEDATAKAQSVVGGTPLPTPEDNQSALAEEKAKLEAEKAALEQEKAELEAQKKELAALKKQAETAQKAADKAAKKAGEVEDQNPPPPAA